VQESRNRHLPTANPKRRPMPRTFGKFTLVAYIIVVAVSLNACVGAEDSESSTTPTLSGHIPEPFSSSTSVVTLTPIDGAASAAPPDTAQMDQYAVTFIPELLIARVGQTVRFQNSEEIHHNVRLVETATDSTWFNVVTVTGDPYVHTFTRTGWFDVSCDMHPGMSAFLFVTDDEFWAIPDDAGYFSFDVLPAGTYRASLWTRSAVEPVTLEIEVTSTPMDVSFDSVR